MRLSAGTRLLAGKLLISGALIAMLPLIFTVARSEKSAALSPNRWTATEVDAAVIEIKDPALLIEHAREMARARPLEVAPYFIAAAVAGGSGDERRSIALLQESARRRVSFAPAHAWLAGHYLKAGKSAPAILQADLAMRVDAELRKTLIPLLIPQLDTPEGFRALQTALDRSPRWRVEFLTAAIKKGSAPKALFAILGSTPSNANLEKLRMHREMFIRRLIEVNDPERAYLAWVSFLPDEAIGKVGTVYDGDFRGFPGSPPFNWTLSSVDGVADYGFPGSTEGLVIHYPGRKRMALASQTLFLPAGSWRLTAEGKGERGEESGGLKWRLTCQSDDREIGAMPVNLDMEWGERAIIFRVPESGCELQQLTLIGDLSETNETITGQVRGVRIIRVGVRP